MDKAPFRLNAIQIHNLETTTSQFSTLITSLYKQRALKNLLPLFLSSNAVLGNVRLWASDFGTGIKEFFYLPASGIMKGPLEGGRGVYRGTASLLCYTQKGTFGAIARCSSSLSKGVLIFAGDEEFMVRRERESISKPSNVLYGLREGMRSGFTGVASGISGIYYQPMIGAREEGVRGFVKGGVKGLGGAVLKPVSGALDLVAKTSEGAHSMVDFNRRLNQDGILAES